MSSVCAKADDRATTIETLCDVARDFVPEVRRRAAGMERARRLDDDLVDALDDAGLFSLLVPKRWGGFGLGPVEANQIAEILGGADLSTAWVSTFFINHNWLLCRYPIEVQQEAYRNRRSVRVAAVFNPPGKVEVVADGYRLTGRWGYASGMQHAHYVMAPGMLGDEVYWFLLPRDDVQMLDDWRMGSMSATGSITVAAQDLFVPSARALPIRTIVSTKSAEDAIHPEPAYRLSYGALGLTNASSCIGGLEAALEISKEKYQTSKPYGIARIDRELSRARWTQAYQFLRAARYVRDGAMRGSVALSSDGAAHTPTDEAGFGLDSMFIIHGAKDAVRALLDGGGTSGYDVEGQVRRLAGDIAMMSTHVIGYDYDVLLERHSRWVMGIGPGPLDPSVRLAG